MHSQNHRGGRILAACMLIAVVTLSCSTDRDAGEFFAPEDVGILVVDAVLTVGKPFPRMVVSRTLSPQIPYTQSAAAERNATVIISSRAGGPPVTYAETSTRGLYAPRSLAVVAPLTTYDLVVQTTSSEVLTATTTTPDVFEVDEWVLLDPSGQSVRRRLRTFDELGDSVYNALENQVTYSEGLVEARFARPDVEAFQLAIFSLDLDSDFVIEPEFFEEDDFDDIEREGSSPAILADEGTARLPWFAIFFQGRHKLKIFALDRNAYDLVRSTPEGSGTFSFGESVGDGFERPIFHVEGGIGLFGSVSGDSLGFMIWPRP